MTSAAAVLYIGDKQKSLLSSSKGVINIRFQVVILGMQKAVTEEEEERGK